MENEKRIAFDLDNTLCEGHPYKTAKPKQAMIDILNQLYDAGYHISIYTGRGMRTFGVESKAISVYRELTLRQLKDWGIKYHDLNFGKIDYDLMVCDKVVNSRDIKKAKDIEAALNR